MAFPKTRSHIIALFVDHGLTEEQAMNLVRDCCKSDGHYWDPMTVPDKKVIKLAIQTREAELSYLRLIDVS